MLVRMTIAFVGGLLLGSYVPFLPLTLAGFLILIAIGLTAAEQRGRLSTGHSSLVFGAILCGVVYSVVFAWLVGGSTLGRHVGAAVTMTGTVIEPVRHTHDRLVLVIDVHELVSEGQARAARGHLRLTWRGPDQDIRRGDVVSAVVRLRPPGGMVNPGGFDYAAYLERHGIEAVASLSGPGQLTIRRDANTSWAARMWGFVDGWRAQIRTASEASLKEPARSLYLGMIIGEADDVSVDVREAFMATGTVHVLSISGSHLGLIAVVTFFAIRTLVRGLPTRWSLWLSLRITRTRLAAVATVPLLIFYTVLAGAQVATVRSLVMILLFLLAVWLGRHKRVLWTLSTAAVLILLADPRALFDISFQLSFVSVLALALVLREEAAPEGPAPADLRETVSQWMTDYLRLTVGVTLATVPLVAFYFHQIAWLGVISNVVVVPVAGFLLVPAGLVSAMAVLLTGQDTLPGAAVHQAIGDLLVAVVKMAGAMPAAEWHVASPSIGTIVLFYVALGVAALAHETRWARRVAVGTAFVLMGWWTWSPRAIDAHAVHVTFLDVGQGDASLIELPDGQTVLIDGGATYDTFDVGRAVVAPYLWERGIRRLNHVIATHPQLDHIGGLASIAEKFQIDQYWHNGAERDEAFYRRVMAALQQHGIIPRRVAAGDVLLEAGGCRLGVLNPPRPGAASVMTVAQSSGTRLNNDSVVVHLACGSQSFLFPGDVEAAAIDALHRRSPAFGARIVKVPHHGARSSLDVEWLHDAKPELAVVSAGRTNPYGHPAPAVLAAYEQERIPVLRTDRDGAIQIHADLSSSLFQVMRARDNALEKVRPQVGGWAVERRNLMTLWRQWWKLPSLDKDAPGPVLQSS